jgi:hypothetical protein
MTQAISARERIAAGYEKTEKQVKAERTRERAALAALFKPVPQMEAMLAARQRSPVEFARLNVGTLRMAFATYERARNAFHSEGEWSETKGSNENE